MLECGFTNSLCTLKLSDVPLLVKSAALHSTILKIKSELDQFIDGLDTAGLLHTIPCLYLLTVC